MNELLSASTLFHFSTISEKEMLRREVGVKREEGKRTERRFDPPVMWVREDKDELELLCPQSPAVSLPNLGRIFPLTSHLHTCLPL